MWWVPVRVPLGKDGFALSWRQGSEGATGATPRCSRAIPHALHVCLDFRVKPCDSLLGRFGGLQFRKQCDGCFFALQCSAGGREPPPCKRAETARMLATEFHGSIFIGHHDRDFGLRVVNVHRAASGNQFDKAGALVVVADIKRNWQPCLPGLRFAHGKAGHPNDVPESAGFVLACDAGRNSDVIVIDCACEKNRECDSGFARNF
jgi:hypothetical protein